MTLAEMRIMNVDLSKLSCTCTDHRQKQETSTSAKMQNSNPFNRYKPSFSTLLKVMIVLEMVHLNLRLFIYLFFYVNPYMPAKKEHFKVQHPRLVGC